MSRVVSIVESVQKVFTKKLPGMRNLHYEERLLVLSLESLEVRRIKMTWLPVLKF